MSDVNFISTGRFLSFSKTLMLGLESLPGTNTPAYCAHFRYEENKM
jgi:hypothetical protein